MPKNSRTRVPFFDFVLRRYLRRGGKKQRCLFARRCSPVRVPQAIHRRPRRELRVGTVLKKSEHTCALLLRSFKISLFFIFVSYLTKQGEAFHLSEIYSTIDSV